MKITTISVTYGRKFNLGNYESVHLEETVWADLDEEDEAADVEDYLYAFAKHGVKAAALPLIQHRDKLAAEAKEAYAQ